MKHILPGVIAGAASLAMAHGAWASCTINGPGAVPAYGAYASGGIDNSYAEPTCMPGYSSGGGSYYFGTDTNEYTYYGSPATTYASGSAGTAIWGLSSASANLATGDLTVSATSIGDTPYDSTPPPTGVPASAQAGYFVEITFTGGSGETGYVSSGGLISYSGDVSATAGLNFGPGTPQEGAPTVPGFTSIVSGTDLAATTDQSWSLTDGFTIEDGVVYTLAVDIDVGTSGSFGPGTATMTDPFSFDLPSGVTFTASDPSFLTGAVPEPATWALSILGVGMIGVRLRRRARTA
ncbi:MAG: PEPxxWA-CTERM sorting domain-containing protein [Caulobacteraceae bacterium]